MKLVVIFAGLVALTAATPLVFGRDSIDCNIPNGYSLGRLETGVLNQANGHNCMKEAKSNRPEVGQCFFTRIKTAWMEQVESYLLTFTNLIFGPPAGELDHSVELDIRCSMLHGSCIGKCGVLRKNLPCIKDCRGWTIVTDPRCKDFKFPIIFKSDPEALPANITTRGENRINFFPAPEHTGDKFCDKCRDSYRFCVEAAFIPGLPACEEICKKRTLQRDSACDSCEHSQYFPSYKLEKPPIELGRT